MIYASSFSKTIAPGVRVGCFVLPPDLHRAVDAIAVSTYITPVLLGQATVYEFIQRGSFEPNLQRVRRRRELHACDVSAARQAVGRREQLVP